MKDIFRIALGGITLLLSLLVIGYVIWRVLQRSDDPVKLIVKGSVSLLVLLLVLLLVPMAVAAGPAGVLFAVVIGLILAVIWAPNLGALVASPFTRMFEGESEGEAIPLYSIAEAKRKRGLYTEAMAEIQKQLLSFPNDFQGQSMLAEIQAQNLNDLPAASDTVERLVAQPGHYQKNIVFALSRLADWQIHAGQIEVAQQTLQRITLLYPESEEAQLANQRIAHLGNVDRPSLTADRAPIPLPHYAENVGLRSDFTGIRAPEEDLNSVAAKYVAQLEKYPLDAETRKNLALLYASHFQRFDLAVGELEQLIQHPHQTAKQVAHWLNLLADLELKHTNAIAQPFATLQRIIDLYPGTAAAENASHRQRILKLELKGQQKSEAIKLPATDQRLGLR